MRGIHETPTNSFYQSARSNANREPSRLDRGLREE
jgi:hypothetical protein